MPRHPCSWPLQLVGALLSHITVRCSSLVTLAGDWVTCYLWEPFRSLPLGSWEGFLPSTSQCFC